MNREELVEMCFDRGLPFEMEEAELTKQLDEWTRNTLVPYVSPTSGERILKVEAIAIFSIITFLKSQ